MKQQMNNKLRSRAGASITFALLLFLICAVACGVLLAAASTVTGRMSGKGEMDQRYYSVTSAANLLTQELTGTTVKIERKETVTQTWHEEFEEDDEGNIDSSWEENEPTYSYSLVVSAAPSGSEAENFLKARAAYLLFGGPIPADDKEAYEAVCSIESGNAESSAAFTLTPDSEMNGALPVSGTYEMSADGTLVFTIHNNDGDKYEVILTLTPSVCKQETSASHAGGFPDGEITTTTKTSTICWSLGSVEKVVAGEAE